MFGFSYKSAGALADFLRERVSLNFNTVAEMRGSIYVQSGMTVYTLGYNSIGDGGGCKYKIRAKTNADSDDGATKIVCGRKGSWNSNTPSFVAEPVIDTPFLDVRKFGLFEPVVAYDDTPRMIKCLAYCKSHNLYLMVYSEHNYELARKTIANNSAYSSVDVSYNGGYMQSSKLINVFSWEHKPCRVCSYSSTSGGNTVYSHYHKDFDLHSLTYGGTFGTVEDFSSKISTGSNGLSLKTDLCAVRVVDATTARKLVISARVSYDFCFVVFPMDNNKALLSAGYDKIKYTSNGITQYMMPTVQEVSGSDVLQKSYTTETWSGYGMATIDILDNSIRYVAIGVCGKSNSTLIQSMSIETVCKMGEFGDTLSSSSVSVTSKLQPDIETVEISDKTKLDSDGPVGEIIYVKPTNLASLSGTGTIVLGYIKKATTPTWLTLTCSYSAS